MRGAADGVAQSDSIIWSIMTEAAELTELAWNTIHELNNKPQHLGELTMIQYGAPNEHQALHAYFSEAQKLAKHCSKIIKNVKDWYIVLSVNYSDDNDELGLPFKQFDDYIKINNARDVKKHEDLRDLRACKKRMEIVVWDIIIAI